MSARRAWVSHSREGYDGAVGVREAKGPSLVSCGRDAVAFRRDFCLEKGIVSRMTGASWPWNFVPTVNAAMRIFRRWQPLLTSAVLNAPFVRRAPRIGWGSNVRIAVVNLCGVRCGPRRNWRGTRRAPSGCTVPRPVPDSLQSLRIPEGLCRNLGIYFNSLPGSPGWEARRLSRSLSRVIPSHFAARD